ncbi:TPA: DUF551 domain-containing protein [Klebsiella pneumoniae]
MTKSTITRERLQEIAEDGFLKHGESKELARMALAAMDSEPVEMPLDYLQGQKDGLEWAAQLAEANHPETGDWLYDDPIELSKAIRKGPDMPPAQPVADSEPVAEITEDLGRLFVKIHYPTTLKAGDKLYRHAQPAPVVPDAMEPTIEAIKRILPTSNPDEYAACIGADMWNACRATMLAAAQHDTPALNSVQSVVTVPGKWIPVSERMPDCWCLTCRPVVLNDMRFVVCPDCGNKRCPRANDHRNACTGSNEPGQEGGAYPDTPQEVKP